jgi:prepilin-type N-terminal cleavage/methylation domain-containing protein
MIEETWHLYCNLKDKEEVMIMGKDRSRGNGEGNNVIKRLLTQKGMTLLEVAIALFVLAIGLLGLAGLQLVVLQSNSLGHEATLATTLAKEKLAELQKANLPITQGTDHYHDQANGVTYKREWSVQNDTPQRSCDIWPTGPLRVVIRVIWKDSWADRCVTVSAGCQYSEIKEKEGV